MNILPVLGLTIVLSFNPIKTNADPIPYEQAVAESFGMQEQPVEEVEQVNEYTDEDLYYLSRTMWAEARGEGRTGMLHVGSVVLNRVNDRRWPNTIKNVVLQPSQFTVWRSGISPRIRTVTENEATYRVAVEAARHLLENGSINNYRYFESARLGRSGTLIGGHRFR